MLSVARGLSSPSRQRLRDEGLFTLLGAFDAPACSGRFQSDELDVTFRARRIAVRLKTGEALSSPRDLRALVGSVYLPCRCGEVRSVFVPAVTRCSGGL